MDPEGEPPRIFRRAGTADLAFLDGLLEELDPFLMSGVDGANQDRALFLLAVSEVVTNIVTHGGRDASLTVEVVLLPGEARATIEDTAPVAVIPWDRIALPAADAESGRGLAIAREVLDELHHHATDTGNTWSLRRVLGPAS